MPGGNGRSLGKFIVPLRSIHRAQELTVTLKLAKSGYRNQRKIWVYPVQPETNVADVEFTTAVDSAVQLLRAGKTVVLNPDTAHIKGIDGWFAPVFWSSVHFPDQPGSIGLLINDQHPALTDFPTSTYSDWQWWDLVTRSRSVQFDGSVTRQDPIVRVIDNFFRNRHLGLLMEFRTGNGKLLLCTMDIQHDLDNRPAARQLKRSLIQYAGSEKFRPSQEITMEELIKFFK
ncbi:hypothetical protein IM792_02510 [Mucilaginibacter sp. JRF]|uniref:hypothetical protein n=1 Tax=Mucilaginibacter sp. JRF TaxID=2780088 RepID=UPI001881B023|nr:hypothetical protein [Mucilaginibacter sp. JRF]MBE9583310.1 hypothetical protein [Mucilaginibacter sp. JRF]